MCGTEVTEPTRHDSAQSGVQEIVQVPGSSSATTALPTAVSTPAAGRSGATCLVKAKDLYALHSCQDLPVQHLAPLLGIEIPRQNHGSHCRTLCPVRIGGYFGRNSTRLSLGLVCQLIPSSSRRLYVSSSSLSLHSRHRLTCSQHPKCS